MKNQWNDFVEGIWVKEVDVSNFIEMNYEEYLGDGTFLAEATEATKQLWNQSIDLLKQERDAGGVLDHDIDIISTITSHQAGYLNKDLEKIVGFQTDKPLKRAFMPFAGVRFAVKAAKEYGYEINPEIVEMFAKYRKTHSDAVYDAYTPEMRNARRSGIITSLPDTYSRGRIIGDYRRIALYGIEFLIQDKEKQKASLDNEFMTEDVIRLREELSDQIRALHDIKDMAAIYGDDISDPASNAREAIQWLYYGYLAAVKSQNGAAMSLGRTATFIDVFIQRDLKAGLITEEQAQELVDHFIMKLRLVKFSRPHEYNELFSGDPTWVTEVLGGMSVTGKSLVTKTSYRYLQTLYNLGPAPEPNLTILWSADLPKPWKDFCAQTSIDTSALQYENDDLMRPIYGDDYGIACCVSPMIIGKQMQFFGARANIPKMLLYAINGGVDEKLGIQVAPERVPVNKDIIGWEDVEEGFKFYMEWCAKMYVSALNIIHYMHDKYAYEASQMALHDRDVERIFATGMAGLSVAADSIAALKYADEVKVVRDENGVVVDFEVKGEFPCFGNNDDRVDSIANELVEDFMNEIRKHKTYRNGFPTMSVLTITSNVVYGKKTGSTPCGRKMGEPFAPGANPMHGRDKSGALASLESVAKIDFKHAQDGISNTFSVIPNALGKDEIEITSGACPVDESGYSC